MAHARGAGVVIVLEVDDVLGRPAPRDFDLPGLPDGGRPRTGPLDGYQDIAYYFCSLACAGHFAREPERYVT